MACPIFTAKKAAESSRREECESDEKDYRKHRKVGINELALKLRNLGPHGMCRPLEVHSPNENETRRGSSRSNYFTRIGALHSWRTRASGPVAVFFCGVGLGRVWGTVYSRFQTLVAVPGLALRTYTRWFCFLKICDFLTPGTSDWRKVVVASRSRRARCVHCSANTASKRECGAKPMTS